MKKKEPVLSSEKNVKPLKKNFSIFQTEEVKKKEPDNFFELFEDTDKKRLIRQLKEQTRRKLNSCQITINLLEGQLKRREILLEKQRKLFYQELLLLREELFKIKKFPGYSPKDFRLSKWDESNFRTEDEIKRLASSDNLEEFEKRKMEYFKKKNVMLNEMREKNSKLNLTLEKLKKMEEDKDAEMKRVKDEEDKVKNMMEGVEEEKKVLEERMKLYDEKLKNLSSNKLGKENESRLHYLKTIIDKEEEKLRFIQEKLRRTKKMTKESEKNYKSKQEMSRRKEKVLIDKYKLKKLELKGKIQNLETIISEREKKISTLKDQENKVFDNTEKLKREREEEEGKKRERKKKKINALREVLRQEREESKEIDIIKKQEKKKKRRMKLSSIPGFDNLKNITDVESEEFKSLSKQIVGFQDEFEQLFTELELFKTRVNFYKNEKKESSDRINYGKAPEGKVTIVFTDVEDSSKMWDLDVNMMQKCMKIHNKIARKLILEFQGFEVKNEGDAFMIAFGDAFNSIKFSLRLQLELLNAEWPEELYHYQAGKVEKDFQNNSILHRGLRVRSGINTGYPVIENDPVTGRVDYFGTVVIKASRIESLCGNGGYTAISNSVYREIKDIVGDKERELEIFGCRLALKSIGEQTLKGLIDKEDVWVMTPYSLRKRKFKRSNKSNNWNSLSSKINFLLRKYDNLEKERSDIENGMVKQVKIKALEESMLEKDNIIVYLKTRLEDLKESYDNILNDEDEEDDKDYEMIFRQQKEIKDDVENILGRYNNMLGEYQNLKKNYNMVIGVFNKNLKNELSKIETDISGLKQGLSFPSEEGEDKKNGGNEKKWNVKEKSYLNQINYQKDETEKRERVIKNLKKKINDLLSIPNELQALLKNKEDMTKMEENEQIKNELLEEKAKLKKFEEKLEKQRNDIKFLEEENNRNITVKLKEKEESLKMNREMFKIKLEKLRKKESDLERFKMEYQEKIKKQMEMSFQKRIEKLSELQKRDLIEKEKQLEVKYQIIKTDTEKYSPPPTGHKKPPTRGASEENVLKLKKTQIRQLDNKEVEKIKQQAFENLQKKIKFLEDEMKRLKNKERGKDGTGGVNNKEKREEMISKLEKLGKMENELKEKKMELEQMKTELNDSKKLIEKNEIRKFFNNKKNEMFETEKFKKFQSVSKILKKAIKEALVLQNKYDNLNLWDDDLVIDPEKIKLESSDEEEGGTKIKRIESIDEHFPVFRSYINNENENKVNVGYSTPEKTVYKTHRSIEEINQSDDKEILDVSEIYDTPVHMRSTNEKKRSEISFLKNEFEDLSKKFFKTLSNFTKEKRRVKREKRKASSLFKIEDFNGSSYSRTLEKKGPKLFKRRKGRLRPVQKKTFGSTMDRSDLEKFKKWNGLLLEKNFLSEKRKLLNSMYYKRKFNVL